MVSGHASPEATLAVVFTSTFIALIAVSLRLWTRLGIVRQPGLDDLCVTLAIIFTSIFSSCVAVQVRYGLGKHQDSLSDHDSYHLLKWFWVSIWNYYLGLGLAKLSIVLQCFRIFGHIPSFRKAAYVLGTVIFVFTMWTFFVSIFLCKPISKFWIPDGPGTCLNRLPLWFFNSSFNILTDILTAILPLPVVKSLNLPRKQRRMLMAVFGLGGAICAVSLIRFYALYAVAITKDPSWDNPQAALYANLEATVGIIASCLPTLKGLMQKYYPTLFSSTRSGSNEAGLELSGTGKSGATKISHLESATDGRRPRSREWNPLPKKKAKPIVKESRRHSVFGRKLTPGIRMRLTETEIAAGGEVISPAKDGEIKVTTIVEQVEARRRADGEGWHESKEDLVPEVAPYERP